MLIDEAAEHLVADYRSLTVGKIMHFTELVTVLCYLYPAVHPTMATHEVVRNFTRTIPAHR